MNVELTKTQAVAEGAAIPNIHYGRIDASANEVITAAKQAHVHEFIDLHKNS
jgi:ABC-type multidrug transport system fused ATPase/permease subunit